MTSCDPHQDCKVPLKIRKASTICRLLMTLIEVANILVFLRHFGILADTLHPYSITVYEDKVLIIIS